MNGMRRINTKDFKHLAPDVVGEQVNVNHANCPAGTDTKRRLYIKRTRKNGRDIILAYCHHCGLSGVAMGDKQKVKRSREHSGVSTSGDIGNVRMPYDVTGDESQWPYAARSWVRQAALTSEEVKKYGMVYSELYDRVIVPIYNGGEGLSGWIGRRLKGDGPKYLYEGKSDLKFYAVCLKSDSSWVCVVEDILSCIRVSRHMNCIALCGTTVTDKVLVKLSKYSNVLIYLDDDNFDVRKKQRLLKTKLSSLCDNVYLVHSNGTDPKELDDSTLKDLLDSYQTQ